MFVLMEAVPVWFGQCAAGDSRALCMNCRSQEKKRKKRVAPPLLSQMFSLERESITKGETDFFGRLNLIFCF